MLAGPPHREPHYQAVTDAYNSETGALQERNRTSEGKTEKLTSVLNSLGQLTSSYTDAGEQTWTYGYDVDGRLEKANDGKGAQTYSYDPTTGQMTKLRRLGRRDLDRQL